MNVSIEPLAQRPQVHLHPQDILLHVVKGNLCGPELRRLLLNGLEERPHLGSQGRQAVRQTGFQTDRRSGRQVDRQEGRQTDNIHTSTQICSWRKTFAVKQYISRCVKMVRQHGNYIREIFCWGEPGRGADYKVPDAEWAQLEPAEQRRSEPLLLGCGMSLWPLLNNLSSKHLQLCKIRTFKYVQMFV